MSARVRPGRVLLQPETYRALLAELDELRRQVKELRRLAMTLPPGGPAAAEPLSSGALALLRWMRRRHWDKPRVSLLASRGPTCIRSGAAASAAVAQLVAYDLVQREVVDGVAFVSLAPDAAQGTPAAPEASAASAEPEAAPEPPAAEEPATVSVFAASFEVEKADMPQAADETDLDEAPTYVVLERRDHGQPTGRYFAAFSAIDLPLTTPDPEQARRFPTQGAAILWLSGERKRLGGFAVREFEAVGSVEA